MKSAELTLGRTFSVTFEHGKDFFTELKEFCAVNNVKQGYIPFFIAGMSEVELVGTCEKIEDKNAPIWSSEIARLRQRITEEYEAAMRGLSGFASGSARHQFITRRMEQIGTYHETLQHLVGEQEATRIMAETLEAL